MDPGDATFPANVEDRAYQWRQPVWDNNWTNTSGDVEQMVNRRQVSYRNPMFFAMLRFYNKFTVSGAETSVTWDTRPQSFPVHNYAIGAARSNYNTASVPDNQIVGVEQANPISPATQPPTSAQLAGVYGPAFDDEMTSGTNDANLAPNGAIGLTTNALKHPQTVPTDASLCVAINRRLERKPAASEVNGALFEGFISEQKQADHDLLSENVKALSKHEKFPKKYMKGRPPPVFNQDGTVAFPAKSKQPQPVTVVKKYKPRELHKVPKAIPLARLPMEPFTGEYKWDTPDQARTMEDVVDQDKVQYADHQCLQYHIRESVSKDQDMRLHSVSTLCPVMVTVKLKQHVFFHDRTQFSVDSHLGSATFGNHRPPKPALPVIQQCTQNVGTTDLSNVRWAKDYTHERMLLGSHA